MQNKYTTPSLDLYVGEEDVLMLSSGAPTTPGGGGGSNNGGAIELPPIPAPQSHAGAYTPPSISVEDAPTDILMGSGEGSSGGVGNLVGGWGGDDTDVGLPVIPWPPKN